MRALVLGAAVSGTAAARLLLADGAEVAVYDDNPAARWDGDLIGPPWDDDDLDGVDLVVASPGVPQSHPALEAAERRSIPVWGEIELAWRHLDGVPVVAVTGTNGKTTVTEMIAAMLSASGMQTAAVGNIGKALADVAGDPWDVLVVEVSSFQLRFTPTFAPTAAVLLNVAPDHFDWHGSFEGYLEAKANIYANMAEDAPVIYDVDDPGAVRAVAAAATSVPVSGRRRPQGGSGPEGGKLWLGDSAIEMSSLPALDPVFLVDLAAAGTAAMAAGATLDAVAEVARTFRTGRHRREVLGEWDGVTWVDDSKATNPHAALAAIDAFHSVVLIAGGRNKGLDLAPLATRRNVRHLIAIGEAAPDLLAAAGDIGTFASSMEEAVATARRLARPGDVVLLAPGCSSFDMFDDYAHRGDVFASLARGEG